LWAVALAIGLRRGEALGLRWVDVDLVNGRVVITKALSRVGANLALRDVKTESSAASVPLPEELVAILRRHRRDQFGDPQVARANTLGLVFTTKNGTPLEPRNVNRAFETLCRRANVRSIRCTTFGIRVPRCCSRWVSRRQQCSAFFVIVRFL
jgi:integrase